MGKCEYCGKNDELRPYGRGGAFICFECGMKPEHKSETEANYDAQLRAIGGLAAIGRESGPVPASTAFAGVTFIVVDAGPVLHDGEVIGSIGDGDILQNEKKGLAFCAQATFKMISAALSSGPHLN